MNGLHRIRASAGSGKTHRLTGMFLEMLAEAEPPAGTRGAWRRGACGLPPAEGAGRAWSDVMGVTFTNAAAQEMKERVLSGLKGIALGGENSPENLARLDKGNGVVSRGRSAALLRRSQPAHH